MKWLHELKKQVPYLLPILFFYTVFHPLVLHLPISDMVKKGAVIENIFLYIPLVVLLMSLSYAIRHGFSILFLVMVALLYVFSVFSYGELIVLYQSVYTGIAAVGLAIGHGIHHLIQKRKTRK